jgi:hypothetical protein
MGSSGDFETMIVVGSGELELNFRPELDVNW